VADAFLADAISWNLAGDLTMRPAGRGPAAGDVGSARGSTEIFHTVQRGVSIGASMQALHITGQ
jgi:hypothetical protein